MYLIKSFDHEESRALLGLAQFDKKPTSLQYHTKDSLCTTNMGSWGDFVFFLYWGYIYVYYKRDTKLSHYTVHAKSI